MVNDMIGFGFGGDGLGFLGRMHIQVDCVVAWFASGLRPRRMWLR